MSHYRFSWGNNEKRATLKGRKCRIIATGRMRSTLVQFVDNGQCEIVSRWALRRCEPAGRDNCGCFDHTGAVSALHDSSLRYRHGTKKT